MLRDILPTLALVFIHLAQSAILRFETALPITTLSTQDVTSTIFMGGCSYPSLNNSNGNIICPNQGQVWSQAKTTPTVFNLSKTMIDAPTNIDISGNSLWVSSGSGTINQMSITTKTVTNPIRSCKNENIVAAMMNPWTTGEMLFLSNENNMAKVLSVPMNANCSAKRKTIMSEGNQTAMGFARLTFKYFPANGTRNESGSFLVVGMYQTKDPSTANLYVINMTDTAYTSKSYNFSAKDFTPFQMAVDPVWGHVYKIGLSQKNPNNTMLMFYHFNSDGYGYDWHTEFNVDTTAKLKSGKVQMIPTSVAIDTNGRVVFSQYYYSKYTKVSSSRVMQACPWGTWWNGSVCNQCGGFDHIKSRFKPDGCSCYALHQHVYSDPGCTFDLSTLNDLKFGGKEVLIAIIMAVPTGLLCLHYWCCHVARDATASEE